MVINDVLQYLKRASILPVAKDKKPLIPWKEFQSRKPTEDEVREWFKKFPDMNIGIITGKISDLIVVDVEKGGDVSDLPDTLISKTGGGGWHYYYRYTEGITNKARIRKLTDIRGEAGFVIAPPSIHASGVKYEWANRNMPTIFPKYLFGFKNNEDWAEISSGVSEGQRNETASKYIGKLMNVFSPDTWESTVWETARIWNNRNIPALSERELRVVYESISRKAIKNNRKIEPKEQSIVDFIPFTKVLQDGINTLLTTQEKDIVSFGYDWLDDKLTGLFPGELVIIGGESGCLHPDTKIYNPVDKTDFTVKERYERGKNFYVFSLNKKKEVIITMAMPPKKFFKTKMYELSNGKNKIITTGKHRVFDGKKYTKVCELSKSSSFLLPTTSVSCLLDYLANGQHCWKKVVSFQFDYRFLSHFCGQLLRKVKDIVLNVFPSQADVHGHNQPMFCKDASGVLLEYNHLYQLFSLQSKQDYDYLVNNIPSDEYLSHFESSIFSRTFQRHPLFGKFYSYLCQIYKDVNIALFVYLSNVLNIFLGFLGLTYFHYSRWEVKPQGGEVYYDFQVPNYHNYYASGLFHHNSGKSTFSTNIIYKASQQRKCVVFALEDRLDDYAIKKLYFEIGKIRHERGQKNYKWNDYRKNIISREQIQEELTKASENLKQNDIYFANVKQQMDIDLLEKLIEEQVNNGISLFLIDHLHYFNLLKGNANKSDYIESLMVRLKTLQNKTGARVILVVHYKKLDGKKPRLDSFKDSIAIVQNANYVINIWRERDRVDELNRYKTTFYIPKSRNPNGEGIIEVEFDPDTNDYKSYQGWQLVDLPKEKPISSFNNY